MTTRSLEKTSPRSSKEILESKSKIVKMNTCERESFQLKKAYEDALPSINTAAERIQIAMGLESGVFDDRRQLVVAPWHMPLPRELQGQPQKGHLQHIKAAPDATKSELDIDTRPDKQAPFGPRPKRGRRRGRPSNQLERSLHNKTLAQNIATFETQMSAALQARDASLPPPAKGPRHPFKADELMSKILKRKLSMVRIPPAPRDGPLDGEVPNLVDQPDVQFYRRMTGRSTSKVDVSLKTGKVKYPKIFHPEVEPEVKPDSPSPPRRRSMPRVSSCGRGPGVSLCLLSFFSFTLVSL